MNDYFDDEELRKDAKRLFAGEYTEEELEEIVNSLPSIDDEFFSSAERRPIISTPNQEDTSISIDNSRRPKPILGGHEHS